MILGHLSALSAFFIQLYETVESFPLSDGFAAVFTERIASSVSLLKALPLPEGHYIE